VIGGGADGTIEGMVATVVSWRTTVQIGLRTEEATQ
jgi:hypothetical protein